MKYLNILLILFLMACNPSPDPTVEGNGGVDMEGGDLTPQTGIAPNESTPLGIGSLGTAGGSNEIGGASLNDSQTRPPKFVTVNGRQGLNEFYIKVTLSEDGSSALLNNVVVNNNTLATIYLISPDSIVYKVSFSSPTTISKVSVNFSQNITFNKLRTVYISSTDENLKDVYTAENLNDERTIIVNNNQLNFQIGYNSCSNGQVVGQYGNCVSFPRLCTDLGTNNELGYSKKCSVKRDDGEHVYCYFAQTREKCIDPFTDKSICSSVSPYIQYDNQMFWLEQLGNILSSAQCKKE